MASLFGLEITDLDVGHVPVEAIVFVKTVDEDGHDCWMRRLTNGLSETEIIGLLHCEVLRAAEIFNSRWLDDDLDNE